MWDSVETLDPEEAEYQVGDEQVLVVIVPTLQDWAHVTEDHWYRIPLARAPQRLGAQYLAFYHTKRFGEMRWSIRHYAPVERYALVRRVDLFPSAPDHPRADEYYFKVELGPLETLSHPIPSEKLRRITFITTTLERLLQAREITELWSRELAQDRLWQALKERGVYACYGYEIEGERQPVADLVIPCRKGTVAVRCVESDDVVAAQPRLVLREALPESSMGHELVFLRYTVHELMAHVERCAGEICKRVTAQGRQG